MRSPRVIVIGAGIAGLSAALELAVHGLEVTVVERMAQSGGKMREQQVGGRQIDAGPTVLTLRDVFDELFDLAGASLEDRVPMRRASVLARHAWDGGGQIDLPDGRSAAADAIAAFAGPAEARGYLAFCAEAQRIFEALENTFIRADLPTPVGLARRFGLAGTSDLLAIRPFTPLWKVLRGHFRDARLRQLFGRYATYCGASPFRAPATLMLVAHVEQSGVWLVRGGMHRLAVAMQDLAEARGVAFRHGVSVDEIVVADGRVSGLVLDNGETIAADLVVSTADAGAYAAGCFGAAVAAACDPVPPAARSQSALTVSMLARTDGFAPAHHTVFFSTDYEAEFVDVFDRGQLPDAPTVYVCAQDRDDAGTLRADGASERLFWIINAPPNGDVRGFQQEEIDRCLTAATALMARCGLTLSWQEPPAITTPAQFAAMFPGTGGALYGRAPHGAMASFRRPGSRSRIPGLYLAGGSIHPGPGAPMAVISGRLAAEALLRDHASTRRFHPVAMPGGMSMQSATTVRTR